MCENKTDFRASPDYCCLLPHRNTGWSKHVMGDPGSIIAAVAEIFRLGSYVLLILELFQDSRGKYHSSYVENNNNNNNMSTDNASITILSIFFSLIPMLVKRVRDSEIICRYVSRHYN